MIPTNHIRIRRRRPLRLTRATLSTRLRRRRHNRALLRSRATLLPLSAKAADATALLPRKLSGSRLASNSAVAGLCVAAGLLVRDDVVRGAALLVGDLLVVLVGLGVLEYDVPCVEEAGEHAETAEADVDERVGATDALLDPYWRCVSGGSLRDWLCKRRWCLRARDIPPSGGKSTASSIRKQSVPHMLIEMLVLMRQECVIVGFMSCGVDGGWKCRVTEFCRLS
jgi:hypothetical protein